MRLTPSDIYTRYRPSLCDLRVFLRQRGAPESEPSPYENVLRVLGRRHEQRHLETFPVYEDLRQITNSTELAKRTSIAISASAPVIYQPLLKANITIGDVECEVIGRPDFLVRQEAGYKIRDSKMSRRINKKDHPEIILQMQLYGWLFRQDFPTANFVLEVHAGTGEIVPISYDGDEVVLEELRRVVQIAQLQSEPFSPVGLSKCGHCGFNDRCWQIAESNRSVALVPNLDQALAVALYHQGTKTIAQLIETFDETKLAEIQRPQGGKLRRVGNKATSILRNAQSLATGKETFLCNPWIRPSTNWVMFDLEGLPAHFDEWQKVYLWGVQVFGESQSSYLAATAGFGPEGEREGWLDFLRNAASIFETYGDIPFIHWATYEATLLKIYIDRFGDQSGVAARVQRNLVNLLPIVQTSFILPLPSYSLKVIEKYIGFRRTQDEYGGDWSMAKYIEATETEDENLRNQVMEAIRTYNREDLEATWAVLQWLFSKRQTVEPLFSPI
jgi:predicted RecB family nuclease